MAVPLALEVAEATVLPWSSLRVTVAPARKGLAGSKKESSFWTDTVSWTGAAKGDGTTRKEKGTWMALGSAAAPTVSTPAGKHKTQGETRRRGRWYAGSILEPPGSALASFFRFSDFGMKEHGLMFGVQEPQQQWE